MRAGVQSGARERAVTALARAGALDDQRLAERRAASLAERGWGDAAIRLRLEGEGLRPDVVETAIAHLSRNPSGRHGSSPGPRIAARPGVSSRAEDSIPRSSPTQSRRWTRTTRAG